MFPSNSMIFMFGILKNIKGFPKHAASSWAKMKCLDQIYGSQPSKRARLGKPLFSNRLKSWITWDYELRNPPLEMVKSC